MRARPISVPFGGGCLLFLSGSMLGSLVVLGVVRYQIGPRVAEALRYATESGRELSTADEAPLDSTPDVAPASPEHDERFLEEMARIESDCIRPFAERNPDVTGSWIAMLDVSPDGTISEATLTESTPRIPPVRACIQQRLELAEFPPSGTHRSLTYPFELPTP